jgi:hypothetical protein
LDFSPLPRFGQQEGEEAWVVSEDDALHECGDPQGELFSIPLNPQGLQAKKKEILRNQRHFANDARRRASEDEVP